MDFSTDFELDRIGLGDLDRAFRPGVAAGMVMLILKLQKNVDVVKNISREGCR
jgi:hypothetical protein